MTEIVKSSLALLLITPTKQVFSVWNWSDDYQLQTIKDASC
jgi:hypothetical protein